MKTFIVLFSLLLTIAACNDGCSRIVIEADGRTFSVVAVDNDGDCPDYYILTHAEQTLYILADEMPAIIEDGFVFLTWEQIVEFALLQAPTCEDFPPDEPDDNDHINCDFPGKGHHYGWFKKHNPHSICD